jgi:hypothetical protein
MDYRQPIEPQILVLVVVGLVGMQPQESYVVEDEDAFAVDAELQPAN